LGVYAVADNSYTVNIIGGTGRFAGATGSTIGVLDTNQGRLSFGIRERSASRDWNSEHIGGIWLRKVPDLSFAIS
jgi:hypothetical protein